MYTTKRSRDVLHVDTETVVLDLAEAAPDAEDHPAARQVVEQRDLLGAAHRIVPGQHDHPGAQPHVGVAGRAVREELDGVWRQEVVGEVVLDRPDRLEATRDRQVDEGELVGVDVGVGAQVPEVLEGHGVADVHRWLLVVGRSGQVVSTQTESNQALAWLR